MHLNPLQRLLRWIPVEESLPDSDLTVMTFSPVGSDEPVWLGYWDGEFWYSAEGFRIFVTHWMEFPEPPTEVSHGA